MATPLPRPSLPTPRARHRRRRRRDLWSLRSSWLRLRPLAYWLTVAGVAVLAGAMVAGALEDARAVAARFGQTETVWVARRSLAAGEVLGPSDAEPRQLPVAVIPETPFAREVDGRVVRHPIEPGEVLVDARLAPPGAVGAAALVDPGRRALTVPGHRQPATARVGDLVDLVAVTAIGAESTVVARRAEVVGLTDDGNVTVAITEAEVPATAGAIVEGTIVLAIHRTP